MSGHLGPAVTALVDGELRHDRREQVLAHLAHCSPCRVEVEVLRTVKATMRRAEPALPTGLAQRLAAAAAVSVGTIGMLLGIARVVMILAAISRIDRLLP